MHVLDLDEGEEWSGRLRNLSWMVVNDEVGMRAWEIMMLKSCRLKLTCESRGRGSL